MTPEAAADAWLRYLLRVGPSVDGVVVARIAALLADNDTEPEVLLALAAGLAAIAGVLAEEAACLPASVPA